MSFKVALGVYPDAAGTALTGQGSGTVKAFSVDSAPSTLSTTKASFAASIASATSITFVPAATSSSTTASPIQSGWAIADASGSGTYIPAGSWTAQMRVAASVATASMSYAINVYKYNASSGFTLLFTLTSATATSSTSNTNIALSGTNPTAVKLGAGDTIHTEWIATAHSTAAACTITLQTSGSTYLVPPAPIGPYYGPQLGGGGTLTARRKLSVVLSGGGTLRAPVHKTAIEVAKLTGGGTLRAPVHKTAITTARLSGGGALTGKYRPIPRQTMPVGWTPAAPVRWGKSTKQKNDIVVVGEAGTTMIPRYVEPYRMGVMAFHGAFGSGVDIASTSTDEPSISRICRTISFAGYPIVASDAGGQTPFGNDTFSAVADEMRANLNGYGPRQDKVILLGWSMGVLHCLRYARDYPSQVAGILAFIPGINIEGLRLENPFGLRTTIEADWGLPPNSDPTAYPIPDRGNPMHADNIALVNGIPMHAWCSTADPVALYSDLQAYQALRNTGDVVITINSTTAGHSDAAISPTLDSDVLTFINSLT